MSFDLHHPATIDEASALALRLGDSAHFIAGGTDLVIQINRKARTPAHLISLTRLDPLRGITEDEDGITIGALTTHKTIERHDLFSGALAAVAEGARVIGGHQVRNIATIGGNIANASPAADLLPPLLVLGAQLVLTTGDAERVVPLRDFLLKPGRTTRTIGEILSKIRLPKPDIRSTSAFLKAGRRKAMEISIVSVAASLSLDPTDGRCRNVRVALGAVAPTAIRASEAESILEGQTASEALFGEAGRAASRQCSAISDVRASARYRLLLVETMVDRALAACVARARERHIEG
jgi:carbon-monoxide dehydrogenase medium subunit